MLQTPEPVLDEQELNIPPPIVLQEEKPKSKFPVWLLVLFIIGLAASLGTTAFIVATYNKKESTPVRRTVIVTPTSLPIVETTEAPQQAQDITPTVIPTIFQGKYINESAKFTLEYPLEWQKSGEGIYEIYSGSGGKMYIGQETNTDLDIEVWFDSRFAQSENPPTKGQLFKNRHGVQILESTVQDEKGPLRYYFVTPTNTVMSISLTVSDNTQANRALQVIYGKILDTVAFIE